MTQDSSEAAISALFNAQSLAVIGASNHPRKLGGRPVLWSRVGGYAGHVYPINSSESEVHGYRAYRSILDVDAEVECAYIALPAPAVEQAIRDCVRKGVKTAIVISAGFAETGDEGRALQERIVSIARDGGMRLLGPNCMGAMNVDAAFYPLFYTVLDEASGKVPLNGSLSLVSQSGAFGAHLFELALARGIGFSKWVTTGNQADINVADCIDYLADDEQTRAVLLYLEGSPDPERLMAALRKARRNGKPVILLKSGRSEIGQVAVQSHTGTLAGSDRAFDAMCTQAGAFRALTIDELLDIGAACAEGVFPVRQSVGLVTVSGGVGALMADYAEELGLELPELPASAQEKLLRIFPAGSARNPIDPTGLWAGDTTVFGTSLRALLDEGGHDAVVMFLSTAGVSAYHEPRILDEILAVRKDFPDRLVVVSMISAPQTRSRWRKAGLGVYEDPRRALEVVAALARFGSNARTVQDDAPPGVSIQTDLAAGGPLNEIQATSILEAAGIPFAPARVAASSDEAAAIARQIGFPAVVKLLSPDIAHKSEIGGVVTNLATAAEVSQAFNLVRQRAAEAAPGARLEGALVARQVVGGIETILGVSQDPAAGTLIMFGIGGIFVEIYKDVAFRVAPVSVTEAHAMIREVKGFPMLDGARGKAPADVDAIAHAISRLSHFAVRHKDVIESIDINPFIVLRRGEGAFGVDALIARKK